MLADEIRKRGPIKKIGVLGMGYVGIPAAALFADAPAVRPGVRFPAGLAVIRVQDRDAQPRGEPAEGRGARA